MKNFKRLAFLCLISIAAHAEIVVIGNLQSANTALSKQSVQDIFMGRTRALPDGNFALPLDLQSLRGEFYNKLTNRPIEQINAYWARIMFSGQASPPTTLPDEKSVIKTVIENKGAIGYIDKKSLNPKHVKVLLNLE